MEARPQVQETRGECARQGERGPAKGLRTPVCGTGRLRRKSPLEDDQSEGQEAKGTESSWSTVRCHQENQRGSL